MKIFSPTDCQETLEALRPARERHPNHRLLLDASRRRRGPLSLLWSEFVQKRFLTDGTYFIGTTPGGLKFLGDYTDLDSAVWELKADNNAGMLKALTERLPAGGGTFIDVGANSGVLASLIATRLGGFEKVIAIEPNPEVARRAAATFALNNIQNGYVFCAAVGEEDGTLELKIARGLSGQSSAYTIDAPVFRNVRDYPTESVSVPCLRLDTLDAQGHLGVPSLIKIDVEGHELAVLRGGQGVLSRTRPALLAEFNPRCASAAGWGAPEFAQTLAPLGEYRIEVFSSHHDPAPFPPDPASRRIVDLFARPA